MLALDCQGNLKLFITPERSTPFQSNQLLKYTCQVELILLTICQISIKYCKNEYSEMNVQYINEYTTDFRIIFKFK